MTLASTGIENSLKADKKTLRTSRKVLVQKLANRNTCTGKAVSKIYLYRLAFESEKR